MNPRIAVTGMGLISRFGDAPATFDATCEGHSGAVSFSGPEWTSPTVRRGAIVSEDPTAETAPSSIRRLDRAARFAVHASEEAWKDAGASIGEVPPERRAVLIGTARGCLETTEQTLKALWAVDKAEPGSLSPFATPNSMASSPTAAVSILLDCQGPVFGITAACASSVHALGMGARLIQSGMADLAIAGGTEACVTPAYVAMAHRSGILSPTECRPFDRRRDGTLLGEGAGGLILERWDSALSRGAHIHAELLGYGASSDAESLYTPAEGGATMARAISLALKEAGVHPEEIGYVKAHATGTVKGDAAEARAIRSALGEAASRIPVSSLKPVVGHTIGASSAIESILTILALQRKSLPPTVGLDEPEEDFGLDLIRGAPRDSSARLALSLSSAFGGSNGCLVLGLPPDATSS